MMCITSTATQVQVKEKVEDHKDESPTVKFAQT